MSDFPACAEHCACRGWLQPCVCAENPDSAILVMEAAKNGSLSDGAGVFSRDADACESISRRLGELHREAAGPQFAPEVSLLAPLKRPTARIRGRSMTALCGSALLLAHPHRRFAPDLVMQVPQRTASILAARLPWPHVASAAASIIAPGHQAEPIEGSRHIFSCLTHKRSRHCTRHHGRCLNGVASLHPSLPPQGGRRRIAPELRR
jgi:hypothetical protein